MIEKKNNLQILLLETPFLSQTGSQEVRAYVQSKYNLALLALGSYVKAHSRFSVSIINMVKDRLSEDALVDKMRGDPPDIIGISLSSYCLTTAYHIALRLKKEFPAVHICAGGPHVNIYPEETILLAPIDSIVLGDGEEPFLEICRQISESGELDDAAMPGGVVTKTSLAAGKPFSASVMDKLDELPLPDLSLLGDYKRYRDFLSNKTMALLSTSRGCPNLCHYCWSQKSRYRRFSVEYVMNALQRFKEMGIEYVEFWDETFNSTNRRLAGFAKALAEADLNLTWAIRGAVVNHAPLDILRALKKTGLRLVQFGVETGRPRLLGYLNKRIDHGKVINAFNNCRRAGIRTVANLMINIPGQTKEEVFADFKLIKSIRPTYISISIYNWAPGTRLYEDALKSGMLKNDYWKRYAANPSEPEPVIHPQNDLPLDQVYRLRSRFGFNYYFNIPYIFDYYKLIDGNEIKRAAEIAWMMLKSSIIQKVA
jgi:radical SAM superfamily enzyme YgiQ (UPF0313 family)